MISDPIAGQLFRQIDDLEKLVERLLGKEIPMLGRAGFMTPGAVASISTSSTGFVPTDTAVVINKRNANSDIVVLFAADAFHNSPGNDIYIGIALNGITGVTAVTPNRVPTSAITTIVTANIFTGQPAGSYNPYGYFRVDTGVGNLYGGYRYIMAWEAPFWP